MNFIPEQFVHVEGLGLGARDASGQNALMYALNNADEDKSITLEALEFLILNSNLLDLDLLNQNALSHALRCSPKLLTSKLLSHLIRKSDLSQKSAFGVPAIYSIFTFSPIYPVLDIIDIDDLLYLVSNSDLNAFINLPIDNCQQSFLMHLLFSLPKTKNLDPLFNDDVFEKIVSKTDLSYVNDIGQSCAFALLDMPTSTFVTQHLSWPVKNQIQFAFPKYAPMFISCVPISSIAEVILSNLLSATLEDFSGPYDKNIKYSSCIRQIDLENAVKEINLSPKLQSFETLEIALQLLQYKDTIGKMFNLGCINDEFIKGLISRLDYSCKYVQPKFLVAPIEKHFSSPSYIKDILSLLSLSKKIEINNLGKNASPDERWADLLTLKYIAPIKEQEKYSSLLDVSKIEASFMEYAREENNYNGNIRIYNNSLLNYLLVWQGMGFRHNPEIVYNIVNFSDINKISERLPFFQRQAVQPLIEEVKIIVQKYELSNAVDISQKINIKMKI